jgi:hypothetical protein
MANKTADAINWFKNSIQSLFTKNPPLSAQRPAGPKTIDDPNNYVDRIGPINLGQMFLYVYDPKWKDILPYYDTYPLVIPIDFKSDRFLGLNLHYLPPILRTTLLKRLQETTNNQKYDETTKMQLSYQLLKSTTRYGAFKPCIKWYLNNHVRSRYLTIKPKDWQLACMLPLRQFQKQPSSKVWEDSQNAI